MFLSCRRNIKFLSYIGIFLFILSVHTCEKFEPTPLLLVKTDTITEITTEGIYIDGTVIHVGEEDISQHGFCWSESSTPSIDLETKSQQGARSTQGSFQWLVSGLTPNTIYSIRAYATDEKGTIYGELKTFTTKPITAPELTTSLVKDITLNSAQTGGEISSNGGSEILVRGVCWSTSQSPTIEDKFTEDEDKDGDGVFESTITGLACDTTYYVRAYASNKSTTGYGEQVEFKTVECPRDKPSISTLAISKITQNSAEGGGNITSDGGAEITAKGLCWSTSLNPDLTDSHTDEGGGADEFFSEMTGLGCDTIYFVRAYATNSEGTSFGFNEEFVTGICLSIPTVTTAIVTEITDIKAEGGGEVTDNGNSPIIARGVCWSTLPTPTIEDFKTTDGSDLGLFESQITGLSPKTTYYLRAYATNSVGPGYGDEISFDTWDGSVTDRDGNVYQTVQIGDQVWMKTNLKATQYADGTPIRLVTNSTEWDKLGADEAAYCWYDNDHNNLETYGALYNWFAAVRGTPGSDDIPSGVQGVCPNNWHLPSDAEWKELEKFVGMSASEVEKVDYRGVNEGLKLKEVGSLHWNPPNSGATDEYGFTALPGGYRLSSGVFENLTLGGNFWTATESSTDLPWFRYFGDDSSRVGRWDVYWSTYGLSVRCIED